MGSVLSKVRAAVISLASGATRNCPMIRIPGDGLGLRIPGLLGSG
jgi:hypothetical protein